MSGHAHGTLMAKHADVCACAADGRACTCDDHVGRGMGCHSVPVGIDGVIALAVNPEARVYATVEQHRVHYVRVGALLEVPVTVLNTGFVTSRVEPELGAPLDGVIALSWDRAALHGGPVEQRRLGIVAHEPGWHDVTVHFAFPGEPADLGGRDRVHLLVHAHNAGSPGGLS